MNDIAIPFAAITASTLMALFVSSRLAASTGDIDRARLKTVDGLRAFLALWVLFSHFPIAWGMAARGVWSPQSSPFLLRNFGDVAVAAFFMITGMLFYGKIEREGNSISWPRLYVGRIFRLVPMYMISLALMVAIVFWFTGWELRTTVLRLVASLTAWGMFTLPGNPAINGYGNTRYVLAGVIWTLRYEWLFYLSLPLLAVILQRSNLPGKKTVIAIAIGAVALSVMPDVAIYWFRPRLISPFLYGMLAYEIATNESWTRWLRAPAASFAICAFLALAFFVPPDGFTAFRFACVFCAFSCVASGNSLGGILLLKGARQLGDASYSLYLLHGMFLSIFFYAAPRAGLDLTSLTIWFALPFISAIASGVSIFTYRTIELRFMNMGKTPRENISEVAP